MYSMCTIMSDNNHVAEGSCGLIFVCMCTIVQRWAIVSYFTTMGRGELYIHVA